MIFQSTDTLNTYYSTILHPFFSNLITILYVCVCVLLMSPSMSTLMTVPTDQYLDSDRDTPGYRPDPLGQDTNFGRPSLGRPG